MTVISIEGHHGTSLASAKLIQGDDYRLSKGDEEWLGDGVYFFVEGVNSNTSNLAKEWAVAQSWDNKSKTHKYQQFAVLKSVIEVKEENLLDLTIKEGIEVLEYLVDKYLDKIKTIGKRLSFHDGMLLNLARKEGILPIEVVKGNFFIKFTKERIERINLRTNNCTICAVCNPKKNITSKEIVKIGDIAI